MLELHWRQRLETSFHNLLGRLRRTGVRWIRVIVLAVLGAFTFEVVFPQAWKWWQRDLPLSPSTLRIATWLATAVLFYVVTEPIRIRRSQWRRLLWYPPLWVALVLGIAGAVAFETLQRDRLDQLPRWWSGSIVSAIGAALGLALFVHQLPWKSRRMRPLAARSSVSWPVLEPWIATERPVEHDEPDLFGHRRIAARIARSVDEGLSVALVGAFGAGKTTILNSLRAELDTKSPLVIVAQIDVWAISRPEDVPRIVLSSMLSAMDAFVDTIELRAVPDSYQRLAAAEPSGIVSKILHTDNPGDSINEVARLIPLLEALNGRLVLIVEDAERAGPGFDTRHIERLLWTLRRLPRITFVVAVAQQRTQIDFAKLCDVVELVPLLNEAETLDILNTAYVHWRAAFQEIDIDPHLRRGTGKLGLGAEAHNRYVSYITKTGKATPIAALTALLSTPRAIKHVLRQVDRTWRNLHGEVELDDVIIISALRYGAQEVYEFLIRDIDPARHKPDDILARTKTVKADWAKFIGELPIGSAAQILVDLLGITQLTVGVAVNATGAPQGVHVSDPVDYFRRIASEELAPGELRDQEMLREIEKWNSGRPSTLVEWLVSAADEDDPCSRRWEHFSFRHTDEQLARLTHEVAAAILARDHANARADQGGLIALWRTLIRRFRQDEWIDWLRELALNAIPVSLKFVNDVFHYWTGQHGIVSDAGRDTLRVSIVGAVKASIRSGDALAGVLGNARFPWQVEALVTGTGADTSTDAFRAWRDYLAPLLIDGARTHPEIVLPEIATLAGDPNSGHMSARDDYPPVFVNPFRIDRPRMEALFGERLSEVLSLLAEYSGENPFVVRAQDEVRGWLAERSNQMNA